MRENQQPTDSELLLQIVGYNSEAFEQLYSRYSATIYSLIKEIVSNPRQAERILLNVFSIFLKRLEHYSTTSNNIFTWLTLLARNISIDTIKRMKFVEDIPIYSDEYEIEFILPNLSEQISLINLDERNKLSEKIKSYKSQLSEIQNLILSLIYFEGLNEEEIAKRLNVPPATVRQRIVAIMETLHSQYTGQTRDSKYSKEILNLIKLEALGCISTQERMILNQARNEDAEFLWKEYGEYQNLTALLAITIPETNPSSELNSELAGLFTKILSGEEVEYPIIAAEIPVVEVDEAKPASEIPVEKNEVPETKTEPEVKAAIEPKPQRGDGFQLKFRERDPKELNVLKNLDPVDVKPKTTPAPTQTPQPVAAKTESDIKFKSYPKPPVKNPTTFTAPKPVISEVKTAVNTVPQKENIVQNKVVPAEIKKPELKVEDLKIENDDSSIIIEEPVQVKVQENAAPKNRLIPNSTINLKEILKKDEKPLESKTNPEEKIKLEKIVEEKPVIPFVKEPERKIKSNEPPKELKRDISVDKNETVKPFNPVPPIQNKIETVNKQNEVKEIPKVVPEKKHEEKLIEQKPSAAIVENSGIKLKTNLPPKDIREVKPIENKASDVNTTKQPEPVEEKSEIKFKQNTSPQEIKKTFTDAIKQQSISTQKPSAPEVEKPEIKIKTNEPVKNILKTNTPSANAKETNQQKSVGHNVPITKKEEAKSTTPSSEESFERIKPTIERTAFKVRETVFTESDKKPETSEQKTVIPKHELKSEKVNVDEIVSRIDNEKVKPDVVGETETYEKEIIRLRKKNKRNTIISAVLIVIILAASAFIFLNINKGPADISKTPVKIVESKASNENVDLAGQTDVVITTEVKPEGAIETEKIVNTKEVPVVEEKVVNETKPQTVTEKILDKKDVIPPLPKISTKEESTLFASNTSGNLSINNESPKQTVAAKTETVAPPKETKVAEEEPAFFVAVEQMPELIGGIKELQKKIVYPEIAKRMGTEGKVIVQALVDENGKVISVNTLKGIGSGCDEVAMDAVRNSKFVPGKQRGKNVKVQVTIPVVFKK